jgi:MFS family permease
VCSSDLVLLMMLSIPGFYLIGSAGWPVLLLRALNGIGWGVATTAIMAISSECSPPERMAHSLGILGSAGIVAGAAGPALAEELVRRFDFDAVFTASLAMLAATVLCVRAVRASRPERAPAGAPASAPARGQRFRLPIGPSLAVLLVIAAMPVAHGAVRGSVVNFIALYASGAGLGRIGPFFMAFSLAAILTRLGIGDISDRYGRKRVILPAALLIGLNMFWIASVHSYGVFIGSGSGAGFGQGLIFPALSTYVIDFMGRENKGFALGLYLSLFDVGMGLGSPLFGWVSDVAGHRPMYMAAGGLILILTVVFHLKAPRIPVPAPR